MSGRRLHHRVYFKVTMTMLIPVVFISGCSKKEGCIDPNAANYIYEAQKNDGSCQYDLSFWMNTDKHGPISIYVDDVYEGQLNCYWLGQQPICGVDESNSPGTFCVLNIARFPGKHRVKLVANDGTIWEETYDLRENCLSILIEGV